jgi:hypothetical protein
MALMVHSSRRHRVVFVGVLAMVLVAFSGSVVRATPNFPDAVATHLGMSASPDCTLCHAGTPGRGTVTTPFGTTLRSRGAQAYDEASLRLALDALSAEKKDSDGDGTSDIDELRAGQDPNGSGGDVVKPEYGCTAGPRTPKSGSLAAPLLLLAATLSIRRRLRPQAPVSGRDGYSFLG